MKETILGTIPSKANSYTIGKANGRPCIVKSNLMKKYERPFIKQCQKYKGKNIITPFKLICDVFYPDYIHDLDGCFKALLDCLQYVGAISNDNLCISIVANRHYDCYNPRVEFELVEVNEQKNMFNYFSLE